VEIKFHIICVHLATLFNKIRPLTVKHLKVEEIMPVYFDPVEFIDIDINNENVNFYVIRIAPNRYKFCALTTPLNSSGLFNGDPETTIKRYWPVTREQVLAANMDDLFPEGRIQSAPFTLASLNLALNFQIDPSIMAQEKFGPNIPPLEITWETIPPATGWTLEWTPWWSSVQEALREKSLAAGMDPTKIEEFIKACSKDDAINILHGNLFPLSLLARFDSLNLHAVLRSIPARCIEREEFSLQDVFVIYQQLLNAGLSQEDVYTIIQDERSIKDILSGELMVDDFTLQAAISHQESIHPHDPMALVATRPGLLLREHSVRAVHDGLCTAEQLMGLDDRRLMAVTYMPNAIKALREGRTTFVFLRDTSIDELEAAIATDTYPST
jgi:hypothetical protein